MPVLPLSAAFGFGPVVMIRRAIGARRLWPRLTPAPARRCLRERARRLRQIMQGRLKPENGLVFQQWR